MIRIKNINTLIYITFLFYNIHNADFPHKLEINNPSMRIQEGFKEVTKGCQVMANGIKDLCLEKSKNIFESLQDENTIKAGTKALGFAASGLAFIHGIMPTVNLHRNMRISTEASRHQIEARIAEGELLDPDAIHQIERECDIRWIGQPRTEITILDKIFPNLESQCQSLGSAFVLYFLSTRV